MELIVIPEYSTQGLNTAKWTTDEFLCDIPGPETDAFAKACKETDMYGVFSIMERNHDFPGKSPFNTAIIINNKGEIVLHYHKLNPWVPVEPWYPGNYGIPVCDGPGGSKLAVCICHDGMFPEVAREAAYKGANVLIRISGYSTQVNDQWILTNQSNAWQNLMYTISVNLAGYDGVFYYFGEGQICNFDGTTLQQGQRNPWEIVTGEIYPRWPTRPGTTGHWRITSTILGTGASSLSRAGSLNVPTPSSRTLRPGNTSCRGKAVSRSRMALSTAIRRWRQLISLNRREEQRLAREDKVKIKDGTL